MKRHNTAAGTVAAPSRPASASGGTPSSTAPRTRPSRRPAKSASPPSAVQPEGLDLSDLLNGPELADAWQASLDAWEGASAGDREQCLAFADSLRDGFLEGLGDVPPGPERYLLAALFYAQLKSQWAALNLRSGHRISQGELDYRLFCRSGMLSALLGRVQEALSPEDVSHIDAFLAQPTAEPLGDAPAPPDDVPTDAMQARVRELEERLAEERHERECLCRAAGAEDLEQVAETFRSLQEVVGLLQAEVREARADDAVLAECFGTSEAAAVARQYREAQNRLSALDDLQDMLGSIEQSILLVDS